MYLFTYLSQDHPAPARQVGALGIDINHSIQVYCRSHQVECPESTEARTSLAEWLTRGEEGLSLIQNATDWILESFSKVDEMSWQENILFEFDSVSLCAPIPNPGKVICIAGNYPAQGKMDKPEFPTVFLKPSSGVVGDGHNVILPAAAKNVAYEVELGVVIGRRARNIAPENALACVAGYTLANDMGDRLLEKRTSQWTSGKMFDTFTPMGPVLVTPDELAQKDALEMTTKVNGVIVQHGRTDQMFFDIPHLVSILSELTTLLPGDIILSGSPKLMGETPNPAVSVKAGDRVEVSIEKLGTLFNPAIAEEEE